MQKNTHDWHYHHKFSSWDRRRERCRSCDGNHSLIYFICHHRDSFTVSTFWLCWFVYWSFGAQKTSYIFYHFDGWKFKFALKYAVDCLVTFDNYKCNTLFLRIRIYPSFTSNETCRTLLIFKKSGVEVSYHIHRFWAETRVGKKLQMSIDLNSK